MVRPEVGGPIQEDIKRFPLRVNVSFMVNRSFIA